MKTRNFWPWAIIGNFVIFFAFIVWFIVFATRQKMDLVRDDYYDQEIRFQQQIDKVARTQTFSSQIEIRYAAPLLTIDLPKAQAAQHPNGTVFFYRPSDAQLDERHPLSLDADGAQRMDVRALHPGLWKVRVEWTLDGQDFYYDKSIVVKNS